MDKWLKSQIDKYAGKNFGEADIVVDRKYEAYMTLFDYAKPGMSFLDLGTNSGRVAEEMRRLGLKELGVDLKPIIDKIKYPINKISMNLEKEYPNGEWDLIFCRETIEHLRNFEEVCKKIIISLSQSGVLVITAPCDNRDGPKNCPQHVRIFKGEELDKLVIQSGGKIIKKFNEKRQRVLVIKK